MLKHSLWLNFRNTDFLILFITIFCFFIAEHCVSTIMPLFITEILKFSKSTDGVYIGAYSVTAIIAKFCAGAMADRFGKRSLFLVSIGAVAVVMAVYPFTGHLKSFTCILIFAFALRFFHGFFSGAVRALYQSYTAELVSSGVIGKSVGIIGFAAIISMAIGSFLSVYFAAEYSYKALFFFICGLYVITFLFLLMIRPGNAQQSESWNIKSFIEPKILHLGLLKMLNALAFGLFLAYAVIFGKQYLYDNVGWLIFVYAVANSIMRLVAGHLIDRHFSGAVLIILAYVAQMCGYYVFACFHSQLFLVTGAGIIGIGAGIEYTFINTASIKLVDKKALNRTTSTIEFFYSLGLALSTIMFGLFYSSTLENMFKSVALLFMLPIALVLIFRKNGLKILP